MVYICLPFFLPPFSPSLTSYQEYLSQLLILFKLRSALPCFSVVTYKVANSYFKVIFTCQEYRDFYEWNTNSSNLISSKLKFSKFQHNHSLTMNLYMKFSHCVIQGFSKCWCVCVLYQNIFHPSFSESKILKHLEVATPLIYIVIFSLPSNLYFFKKYFLNIKFGQL